MIRRSPFGADADYEGVDAARNRKTLHLGVAAGRNAFAHQSLAAVVRRPNL